MPIVCSPPGLGQRTTNDQFSELSHVTVFSVALTGKPEVIQKHSLNLWFADHTRSDPETALAVTPRERQTSTGLNQRDLKSATIQAAPVTRKVSTHSDQLKCACG